MLKIKLTADFKRPLHHSNNSLSLREATQAPYMNKNYIPEHILRFGYMGFVQMRVRVGSGPWAPYGLKVENTFHYIVQNMIVCDQ